MRTRIIVATLGVAAVALSSGCAKKQTSKASPTAAATARRSPSSGAPGANEAGGQVRVQDSSGRQFPPIYFDYDTAILTRESREVLVRVAEFLARNAAVNLTVSGHCDERGTSEYNIALGDERARAARDYLVRLGVDGDRIRTLSWGEERPAVEGDDEAAWARNRRAEWEFDGGGAQR